jgi:NDP-sugar pyrophosphorylase family protein
MNVTGVVMAAGFGTRLRPSTQRCPKPLIPVGGIEPLFFALSKLHALGIRRAVVNAHYLHSRISEALLRWTPLLPGMEMRISVEQPAILGTGGGLLKILQENEDFFRGYGMLVQNGDTLASFDLLPLVRDPARSTFAVSYLADHLSKYKPLWVGEEGEWVGIGPDAPAPRARAAHFLGVHFICAADIVRLAEQKHPVQEIDLFNGIYRPLCDAGSRFDSCAYFGAHSNDFWFDMTNREFLLEAQRHVLDSLLTGDGWGKVLKWRYPGIKESSRGVWVASSRSMPANACFSPAVLVESDSSSSDRAVGRLLLGPHASIIHEHGRIESAPGEREFKISNSVVLVGQGTQETLPTEIRDEICVI